MADPDLVVDAETFKAWFPEFERTQEPLIERKLIEAARRCDKDVWGDHYSDGVIYLAAHLLATAPMGQNARLAAQDGSTTYYREYERLQQIVAAGYRVI